MTAKIINGRKIAQEINRNTHNRIELLELKYQKVPNIITIKIGNDPSSDLYLKLRNNACKKVGIVSNSIELSKHITENKILQEISKINRDKNVHGILIQLPLPDHISQNKLFNNIVPIKDVMTDNVNYDALNSLFSGIDFRRQETLIERPIY